MQYPLNHINHMKHIYKRSLKLRLW